MPPAISAAEFKKHISKVFGSEMRQMGFKGSGFHFTRESDDFLFVIGIQGSSWGPSCCVEFGVQPKALRTNGFTEIDFKKLKVYECELTARLSPRWGYDHWWKYSADPSKNINTAAEIAALVKAKVLPVIKHFETNPNVLETIEVEDLQGDEDNLARKLGFSGLSNTSPRLAWMLARINESSNLAKAKAFASYGLADSEVPTFFANPDFERILAK